MNNHNGLLANQDFETAKQAKSAVERYYRIDTLPAIIGISAKHMDNFTVSRLPL